MVYPDTNEGKLPEGGYGVFQLLFLMACYGYFLFNGANLIGDGSSFLHFFVTCFSFPCAFRVLFSCAFRDACDFFRRGAPAPRAIDGGHRRHAGSVRSPAALPFFWRVPGDLF